MEPRRRGRRSGCAEAREALSSLCAAYWYPLYAFIRRKGHGPDKALDLTQEYFAGLLERGRSPRLTPARAGSARSCWRIALTSSPTAKSTIGPLKRGGGKPPLSIDARDAEGRYLREPSHSRTPEHLFERDWALAMLEGVPERLRREYQESGRGETFNALKVALTEDPRSIPQAELAARLGMTPGTVQVAVHRLRKRYRGWSARRSPPQLRTRPKSKARSRSCSRRRDRETK